MHPFQRIESLMYMYVTYLNYMVSQPITSNSTENKLLAMGCDTI